MTHNYGLWQPVPVIYCTRVKRFLSMLSLTRRDSGRQWWFKSICLVIAIITRNCQITCSAPPSVISIYSDCNSMFCSSNINFPPKRIVCFIVVYKNITKISPNIAYKIYLYISLKFS